MDVNSYTWQVFNVYNNMAGWMIPMFVMVSGALFLAKKQSVKEIYKRKILRIISAFLVWATAYAFITRVHTPEMSIGATVKMIFGGYYHMWFLFMIVGLYMVAPFLEKFVESEDLIKYFLLLTLVFTFIIPQFIDYLSFFSEVMSDSASRLLAKMNFHFTLGYVGYFVLGFYLNKIVVKKSIKKWIYIAAIFEFLLSITLSAFISAKLGHPYVVQSVFHINVLLESIAIFVWFKDHPVPDNTFLKKWIKKISKYSFGIYLAHPMVISFLDWIGLNTLSFNAALSVPVICIVVFIVSFILSAVLNRIPFVKEYIV